MPIYLGKKGDIALLNHACLVKERAHMTSAGKHHMESYTTAWHTQGREEVLIPAVRCGGIQ